MKQKNIFLYVSLFLIIACKKEDDKIEPVLSTCEQVNQLASNAEFIAKFQSLYEESKINNFETGYVLFSTSKSSYAYEKVIGEQNKASINVDVDKPLDGYIHCHYSNLYPIFSGSDIRAVYDVYDINQMRNPATFLLGVVSADGNAYILKIDNIELFKQFGQKNFQSLQSFHSFENSYYNQQQSLLSKGRTASFEITLIDMIKNSGLILFKGNMQFNTWLRMEKGADGNLITSACQ
ncbi:hypothetical protein [Solitalea koreensis]|uniref:Lipoprotein n=1 Tax=Solitalea koreensis TaxID=543615 RepID=A0A521DL82_9SPHI|nr:hypothetical protein [Solitalea koreensis]SMO72388.1 hypothetical protein SAMN06265350_107115 [Solitalea koreensis]